MLRCTALGNSSLGPLASRWFPRTTEHAPDAHEWARHTEGEPLRGALDDTSSKSWAGSGEFRAKVVRVSPSADGVVLDNGVCRAT